VVPDGPFRRLDGQLGFFDYIEDPGGPSSGPAREDAADLIHDFPEKRYKWRVPRPPRRFPFSQAVPLFL